MKVSSGDIKGSLKNGKVYAANMYGYKSNRGTLDIIEEEAEVVREIFSKYLSGMSESKIARYLTGKQSPQEEREYKMGFRNNWQDAAK